MKTTGIIILNFNNPSDTINCIESVEKYNTAPVKYIIVDNGSTKKNSTVIIDNYLKSKFNDDYIACNEAYTIERLPRVTFVTSETNDGYAKGNNKGLKFAYKDESIENILILNNDILFVEDIIPTLDKCYYTTLDNPAIICPILYKKDMDGIDYNCARNNTNILLESKKKIMFLFYLMLKKDETAISPDRFLLMNGIPDIPFLNIELPSGSCMFMNKKYFESIGSFDENTFLYWEENILFEKTLASKRKNYLCTNLKCIHLGATTTSKSPSNFIVKSDVNSMLYYFRKYSKQPLYLYLLLKLSCLAYKLQIYIKDMVKTLIMKK